MANLTLASQIQERAAKGTLQNEIKMFSGILGAGSLGDKKIEVALLNFLANIKIVGKYETLPTNVFQVLKNTEDDGVRHRALCILSECSKEDEAKIKAYDYEILQVYSKCIAETKINEVKVIASKLISEVN